MKDEIGISDNFSTPHRSSSKVFFVYIEDMSTYIRHLRLNHYVYFFCLLLLLFSLINQIHLFFQHEIFAADDWHCLHGYEGKLQTEGRWVNYLLHPCISQFHYHVAIICNYILIFLSSLILFRKYFDWKIALIAAVCAAHIPPFCALNRWPLTALPSFLILLLAAIAHCRMSKLRFYILFGILFNGCLSHLYFLLPLFFLNDSKIKSYIKNILYWICGFLLGFFIAEIATFLICGSFIELAEWRRPHYLHQWDDLVRYVGMTAENIAEQAKIWNRVGIAGIALSFIFFCHHVIKYPRKNILTAILISLVAMAAYAQSLPAGLKVELRTLPCLYIALLFFVIWNIRKSLWLVSLITLLIGSRFAYRNAHDAELWRVACEYWAHSLQELPYTYHDTNSVILLNNIKDFDTVGERIRDRIGKQSLDPLSYSYFSWMSAADHLGFCGQHVESKATETLHDLNIDSEKLNFSESSVYYYTMEKNQLILKLKK